MKKTHYLTARSPKFLNLWCILIHSTWLTAVYTSTTQHPQTAAFSPTSQTTAGPVISEEAKLRGAGTTTTVTSDTSHEQTHTICDKLQDTLSWNSTHEPCFQEWRIVASENLGFAVEFHEVHMKGLHFLEVSSRGGNVSVLWRNFTRILKKSLANAATDLSQAPLLLQDQELVIRVSACLPASYISAFRLSYKALDHTPPQLAEAADEDTTESDVIYNCSGVNPPEAIRCDGIHHCAEGEDEAGCSYSHQGCDGWVPYQNQCLKVVFIRNPKHKPGHPHITMPLRAEHYCRSRFNATLAILPDQTGIQNATRLIHRSGFQNAVVGIQKVKPVSRRLRHLYRYLWQWGGERGSPVAYEQQELQRFGTSLDCAVLVASPVPYLWPVECVLPKHVPHGFVCMRPNPSLPVEKVVLNGWTFPPSTFSPDKFPTKVCSDGSLVQTFHRCQWEGMDVDTEEEGSPSGLNLYQCPFGGTIHYSLLCDGKIDCMSPGDEQCCQRPQLSPLRGSSFICRNAQAIGVGQRCNGILDCFDESDEESCNSCGDEEDRIMCRDAGCVPREYVEYFKPFCPPLPPMQPEPLVSHRPGTVELDGDGMSSLHPVQEVLQEGFFCCHEGFCIPSFLLNNGERDCPHGEDEGIPIQNMTCPGFYRCQTSGSCVHTDNVCDRIYHCPNKDDEMYCHQACPAENGCTCEGQAYKCSGMIDLLQHLHVRYLDLSNATGVSLQHIHFLEYLFYLNLSFCQLSRLTLMDMPQLQTLDLSFNSFTQLREIHFRELTGLRYLDLSSNPFSKSISSEFRSFAVLGNFQNLMTLKLVNVRLNSLEAKMFQALSKLQQLDVRNNPIVSISRTCFLGLGKLTVLYTDESKLCCQYFHASLSRCFAPVDELSSCSDLLAQDFFRVCLWAISLMAITGNAGVLIYRSIVNTHTSSPTFRVLVMNLCGSDLLMGLYMMVIGSADIHFRGMYVAKEVEWTKSVSCVTAGVLSFVSSEVSAFVICLITLDRVLVICFPLHPRLHLSRRVAVSSCCLIWFTGLALAVLPLLTGMEFYGQNGICLPLPITRKHFSGQAYAFSIFIVLNFVLFLFIGAGQVVIYRALHQTCTLNTSVRREQDLSIARRLFLVVLTDFCCWFPIGLTGILASAGLPVSGQVNVWAAIFVLPANAALNPFLYTLNRLREQWRKKRKEKTQGSSMALTNTHRF